jgi:hypothetical protein
MKNSGVRGLYTKNLFLLQNPGTMQFVEKKEEKWLFAHKQIFE